MACASCGMAVTTFDQQTVGIATVVDFSCSNSNKYRTAAALRLEYVVQITAENEYQYKQGIDYYELNWRLIMATELLGEGHAETPGIMLNHSGFLYAFPLRRCMVHVS
jgi:hypothetical protein